MSTDETILRYIVPDGSGAMDARLATVNSAGTVTWLHTDHQGSVIATSNDNGEVVEAVSYSPYGEFGPGQSAPPEGSPFGYTGRQFDVETGLYQYRARYFHTQLGVFLSTDPIGTQDDPNLYMYVGLDPVNHIDPTGEKQERFDMDQRRRDLGHDVVDRQNRESSERVNNGVRAIINDIRNDPLGALADGVMIAIDVATIPSGEAAVGIGLRRGAREAGEAAVTRSTRTRAAPGRDGATSQVTTERMGDEVISTTHSVRAPDGRVVHQHQDHIGRSGTVRRFPDEWTGTRTVGDPPPPRQPIPRPRQ